MYNTASSNGYLSSTYGSGHATTFSQTDTQFQFAIYKVGEKYFMYNLAAGKFVGNATNNNTAIPMVDLPSSNIAFKATGNATYPWMISTNNWTGAVNVADTYGCHGIVNWTGGKDNKTDEGNILQIYEAGDLSTDLQKLISARIEWMDTYNSAKNEVNLSLVNHRVGAITESGARIVQAALTAFENELSQTTYDALTTAYSQAVSERITLSAGEKFRLKCIESARGYLAYTTNTAKADANKPTLAGSGNSSLPTLTEDGVYLDWAFVEVDGKKYMYNVEKQRFLTQGTPVTFTGSGTYVTINDLGSMMYGITFEGASNKNLSFSQGWGINACVRMEGSVDNGTKFYIEKTDETDANAALIASRQPKGQLQDLLDKVNTYTIGANVGEYNNSEQNANDVKANAQTVMDNAAATSEDVEASMTALNGITLNLPQVGKLYRFKGKVSGKYMCPSNATGQMAMDVTGDKRATIFMLVEGDDVDGDGIKDYKFLNYEHDKYIKDTHSMGATKANANSIKIAVKDTKDYYTTQSNYTGGGTWLYDNGNKTTSQNTTDAEGNPTTVKVPTPVVDRNGSYAANNCDWTIEEVTWLPIKINETYRYGTFTSPLNLTQDNSRLKFYTGKMNNGYLELTQYTKAIPAGTPFMIEYIEGSQVSQGSSFLQVAGSAPSFEGTNDLVGTLEPIAKPTNQGTIYTLQPAWDDNTADNNSATEVAFRQFNGSNIRGFSAYLPVAAGTQVAGMRFITDEVTVIEGINADQQHKVEAYDLSGRRVQQAKKGLYIINGKKVIIR
ncbi:MAG: hypothetical protein SOY69_04945 [Alloprevotella sp.]|nr:hypothetical protein [Alloprevotella sp.]